MIKLSRSYDLMIFCISEQYSFAVVYMLGGGMVFGICLRLCAGYSSWEMDLETMWFWENEINTQSLMEGL
jgi:hypothetical protein